MSIKKMASMLAKLEGKKSQARIGDIRELLALLSDLIYEDRAEQDLYFCLWDNGFERSKKKG